MSSLRFGAGEARLSFGCVYGLKAVWLSPVPSASPGFLLEVLRVHSLLISF